MIGVLALGVVNGLSLGLLAAGLVLVFRAGRFFNLAHAQLGVIPALLLGKAVLDHGVPWFVAFPIAVALGALIGVGCQVLVIRRLEGRNPLTLVVASLGIVQVLVAATYFTWLGPDRRALTSEGYPVPFEVAIRVGDLVLGGQHVLILVLVPVLTLALNWVLRATLLGKAIRALATNPDAARLAGLPTSAIGAATWGIAGGLSAVSAILAAPGQAAFDTQALGPALLLRALGIAALVGFSRINGAVLVGVAVGVTEAVALDVTRDAGAAEAFLIAAILAVIAFRAGRDRLGDDLSGFRSETSNLMVPAAVRGRWWYGHRKLLAGATTAFLATALTYTPVFSDEGDHFLLTTVVILALVAVSINVITGWNGLLTLGQYAYVGVGAFVAGHMVPAGWSFVWVLIAAAAAGGLVAAVVGGPGLRLGGPGIAVATLGLALVVPNWALRQEWLQPGEVFSVPPPGMRVFGIFQTQRSVFFLSLAVLAGTLVLLWRLQSSNRGRRFLAVRDNPTGASAIGIGPSSTRLAAFALSGAIASLAGAVWLAAFRNLSTIESFNPQQSLVALSVAIIGGVASPAGAIAAALVVHAIPAFTADAVKSIFGNSLQLQLFISGLGLIGTQLQFPGGVAQVGRGLWQRYLTTIARQLPEEDTTSVDAFAPAPEPVHRAPARVRTEAASSGIGASLEVKEVSVAFGGVRALNACSLQVGHNEVVGLIGGNGAGKSTLLNVISGVIAADSGSILAFGQELVGRPATERPSLGIGRSFQDAKLFPDLTVREALILAGDHEEPAGLAASLIGAPWVRLTERRLGDAADEVLGRLGLRPYADTKIAHLSTGTRRIADLGVQLIVRPKLLLLDEPTAGVAQREAEEFGPLIRSIAAELSCSVLLVEHDMPLMFNTADRVYCLEAGRVIAGGSPLEVQSDPAVIASYLGTDATAVKRSGPIRQRRVLRAERVPAARRPVKAAARSSQRPTA